MAEVLALRETEQPPEQTKPEPKRSPWLNRYSWTKETAALARAKSIEVRRQNKLKRLAEEQCCTNRVAVIEDAIRDTKLRMKRSAKVESFERYARLLIDLTAELPKPEPTKSTPTARPASVDPIV